MRTKRDSIFRVISRMLAVRHVGYFATFARFLIDVTLNACKSCF